MKLLPYKVHILNEPDRRKVFLLRGKAVINGVTTVARVSGPSLEEMYNPSGFKLYFSAI